MFQPSYITREHPLPQARRHALLVAPGALGTEDALRNASVRTVPFMLTIPSDGDRARPYAGTHSISVLEPRGSTRLPVRDGTVVCLQESLFRRRHRHGSLGGCVRRTRRSGERRVVISGIRRLYLLVRTA